MSRRRPRRDDKVAQITLRFVCSRGHPSSKSDRLSGSILST
jgi:hypothetical protein